MVKRAKVAGTAAAQFELGSWCEENKLNDLARVHYETALRLDASFDAAHRKLGHIYQDGTWLTRDDVNAAQGLVKYKGRWVTAEEKTKRENVEQTTASQVSWLRRIKLLRQAILNGSNDRRREAEAQLMAIRDADAVVPLVRVFGEDEPARRDPAGLRPVLDRRQGGHQGTDPSGPRRARFRGAFGDTRTPQAAR